VARDVIFSPERRPVRGCFDHERWQITDGVLNRQAVQLGAQPSTAEKKRIA
jgi:hypothetical protein